MKQQQSQSNPQSHDSNITQDTVKLFYNKEPFHLMLELDGDKVVRISFLAADDPQAGCESSKHPYISRMDEYFSGKSHILELPYSLQLSEFASKVYRQTLSIAWGETATYAQIAAGIGSLKAVRAVGAALGANPLPLIIPCHRVIGSNGKLTGFAGGLHIKSLLLQMEKQS